MTLRPWQAEAIAAAIAAESEQPVIQAIMGAGKSVVIAELAMRAEFAVITVPTQALVRQLSAQVEAWTRQVIGQWYADEHDVRPITVVCQMSLDTYEEAWRVRAEYVGNPDRLWIADECHRTECDTVLAWDAPARRVGLTATPWRAEMSESISSFQKLVYEYDAARAVKDGYVVKPTLYHPKPGETDVVVAAWIREQQGGGVVNASSIEDAEQFCRKIDAVCVHSRSDAGADDARRIIKGGGTVVYVDMLAEGFDCPEIAWMALRRPVGSRVRFAQEVGRGLRASEGKTTCHMLDVWDLWGTHSMSWHEALGGSSGVPVPALKLDWLIKKSGWTSKDAERLPPDLLGPLRSWLRQARVQAMFDGRISCKEIKSRSWRSDPCSRKQLAYLDQMMARVDHRSVDAGTVTRIRIARAALVDCLNRDAGDLKGALRKGDASDLIDVVRAL